VDAQAVAQQIRQAVAQVLADPTPQAVQTLRSLVESLPAVTAPVTVVAVAEIAQPSPAPASNNATVPTQSAAPAEAQAPLSLSTLSHGPAPAPSPAQAVVQREALAPLFSVLQASPEPLSVPALQAFISQQQSALQDSRSLPAQHLIQAVQTQVPQAQPEAILQEGLRALQALSQQLQALPPASTFKSPAALQSLASDAGLAAPRVSLQSLPTETVAEAVAWLQARDLPPQRPLVEAVAVFLQQDQDALPAVQRAVAQAQTLPPAVLEARPELKEAVAAAYQALQEASIHPDQPQLSERLQQWVSQQGLDLELRLAEGKSLPELHTASSAPQSAPAQRPELAAPLRPALRPALQQLEQQLRQALKEEPSSSSTTTLQSALQEAQTANRALSAVPLQAQSAPAFDTVHLPLPVALGQAFGGQLSVTWRQGRDRQLNEKDPVSVAVALNTGELGQVKVLLQVWKDAASARVVAQDLETADFLASGADDLKSGFAERTPFALQTLDFKAADPSRPEADAPDLPGPGLTLSA
jgi:hypothetical protein